LPTTFSVSAIRVLLVPTVIGNATGSKNQGEYPMELVLHRSQPEKSGKIRAELYLITSKKVKFIDNTVDLHRE